LPVSGRDKTDAATRSAEALDAERGELIARVRSGGAEAGAAARSLLEAFINGERSRALTDYIAGCLGEYLRGRAPIELALNLSRVLPPVVLGPGGEGDRRSARRAALSTDGTGGAGKPGRASRGREAPAGRRNRRQATWDTAAPDKRSRNRTERRRKTPAPAADSD
jgi:hypothetical protein